MPGVLNGVPGVLDGVPGVLNGAPGVLNGAPGVLDNTPRPSQPEEMLMPKEMYLLKGVNCPEATVLCEQPPNSEVVTAATAEEFYNSIATQAVQYTPEDSDVCFSNESFSGRSEGD